MYVLFFKKNDQKLFPDVGFGYFVNLVVATMNHDYYLTRFLIIRELTNYCQGLLHVGLWNEKLAVRSRRKKIF